MSNILTLLEQNPNHAEIFRKAGKLGDHLGYQVYLVGGYVRDLFLGRQNMDIDLMVEGDGISFARQFAKTLGVHNIVLYEKFKTAFIPYDEVKIEVATSRTENYQPDSRKPDVQEATVKEDMSRRDFTVNAVAVSLSQAAYGDITDPFFGIQDMNKRILRTPLAPDETFSDDPLRMMRAARFSAQLEFDIEPEVFNAIIRQKDRLSIISRERITEEIIKTLKTDTPSRGLMAMKRGGLLQFAFPELDVMSGVDIIHGKGHKDVFLHTLKVVDNSAKLTSKMKIRLAALVHDIAKPATKRFDKSKGWTFHGHDEIGKRMLVGIAQRMKLSKDLRDYLMKMTKLHLRPIALAKKEITDSAIRRVMFEAGDDLDDLMILCRADITTKNPGKVKQYIANFDRVESLMQDVLLRDEMKAFQSPVRGDEIMRVLNLTPGPIIGKIKSAIEEAILDGKIENTYEAAFQYMMENREKIKLK
ncbi:MAG: CCA tRNA nucleotidyltransferase [Fidelibacterota bacterium]